jgi:transposase
LLALDNSDTPINYKLVRGQIERYSKVFIGCRVFQSAVCHHLWEIGFSGRFTSTGKAACTWPSSLPQNIFSKLPTHFFPYHRVSGDRVMKRQYRPVPQDVQLSITAAYRANDPAYSYAALAARFNVPRPTVINIVRRAKNHSGQPFQPRGHRKRTLTEQEEAKICRAVDRNPVLTNQLLARMSGSKICPRTVSNILHRANLPFVRKRFADQEPEQLSEAWRTQVRDFLTRIVTTIPWNQRIYGDESFLYTNEALRYGRGRRGKTLLRTRSYYATKYTLHAYVTSQGPVWWELCRQNANDDEIQRVTRRVERRVGNCSYLFWDRLGKAGRCLNPSKQHWNPGVAARFEAVDVEVVLLPPKGKYLNPIELLFNDLKQFVRRYSSVKKPTMSLRQLRILVNKYMRSVTPAKMNGFFEKRADGQELFELGIL